MSADTIDIIIALIIAIVLHELAHGAVARAFGDKTAQQAGRLTLNPLNHVDRMGTIGVPLILAAGQLATIGHVGFMYGWAKPVPVSPGALRLNGAAHPRQLMAVVAAAGPVANFLLAVLGGLLLYTPLSPIFLTYFIAINLTLGMFNLLPVPPMDGGRIAVGLLPLEAAKFWARSERFGIFGVLLVLFILPAALGQFGVRFDPFQDAMSRAMPWAMHQVLFLTGHDVGN
jgi:Zn-dependent protease